MAGAETSVRFPATGMDIAALLLRAVMVHLELGCRLVFPTRLDAGLLERAVRLSLDAEPVLGCALETSFFTAWWRRLDNLDGRVPFSVVETTETDAEWHRFVGGRVSDTGPQVAVELVHGTDHDEVFVRINHVASDGQAIKFYAYLLADIYSRLALAPDYVAHPNPTPRPSISDALANLSTEQLEGASKEPPRAKREFWKIPPKGLSGTGRDVRERSIDPATFRAIKAYCASSGCSLHDILLAALLRATARSFSTPAGGAMALDFSVDYRRYLDPDARDRIANISSAVSLAVPCSDGEPFAITLERVGEQTSALRDSLWGIRSMAKLERMCGRSLKPISVLMGSVGRKNARKGVANAFLSNFGVFDEERLGFAGVAPDSAVVFGPAPWGSGQLTAVSTYRDTMSVSMGFCNNDHDAASVEGVLDAMLEELRAAAVQTRPGGGRSG